MIYNDLVDRSVFILISTHGNSFGTGKLSATYLHDSGTGQLKFASLQLLSCNAWQGKKRLPPGVFTHDPVVSILITAADEHASEPRQIEMMAKLVKFSHA